MWTIGITAADRSQLFVQRPRVLSQRHCSKHLQPPCLGQTEEGSADLSFVTKYVGQQYLDNTASSERMLDAYVVNDLRANVTLLNLKGTKSVDFNLTMRNIFSELYESNGWVYSYISEDRRQEQVGLSASADRCAGRG